MQWTDRIRQTKILLVVAAVLIAVASLVASNLLTRDLYEEEHKKMEIWAEAMRTLNVDDGNDGMNLVLKVIEDNTTIPVVVVDEKGEVQISRNTDEKASPAELARQWKAAGHSIRILYDDANPKEYIDVCYDDSLMLKRLAVYPYVQLGVVLLFVVIAIFALLTSKRAEQNKVWVGLSKATAHQLGTPISSLMAWTQYLEGKTFDATYSAEINKDLKRLETVTHRFSKIGSVPELKEENVCTAIQNAINYLQTRASRKVKFVTNFPDEELVVPLNSYLFEWVIENICKNAIDAMDGAGTFTVVVSSDTRHVYIDLADTGRGMSPSIQKKIFDSGFTTKQRGWGLGLSLARRIIRDYHKGRIFVKYSVEGQGTVFRIVLNR